jgi:hypothetical protein
MFQVSSGVLFLFFEIKCDQASPGVLFFVWDKSYLSIHGLFSFFEELGLDQCFHPGMFHLFFNFFKYLLFWPGRQGILTGIFVRERLA